MGTRSTFYTGGENHVENLFARLEQYRAIATRYDKKATIFLGAGPIAVETLDVLDRVAWLVDGRCVSDDDVN